MKERSEQNPAYPTLLFVEDNSNDVLLVSRAFLKAGIPASPQFVDGAPELRAYLLGGGKYSNRDRYPVPQLIMTDYKIAGSSVQEIIDCVRCTGKFREVPVVVFSSFVPPREIDAIIRAGACACLEKPVSFSEFCRTLQDVLRFAQN